MTMVQFVAVVAILGTINIALPYLSGLYIDQLVNDTLIEQIATLFVAIAVIYFLQIILKYAQVYVSTKLGNEMSYRVCNDVFQKMFRSDYEQYSNIDLAHYVDQIKKDSTTIVRFFLSNVVNFILQIATLVASAIMIIKADVLLSLIVFMLLPFYIITFKLNRKSIYAARKESAVKSNEYFSRSAEQVYKLLYIQQNVLDAEMDRRLHDSYLNHSKAALNAVKTEYVFTNLNQMIITLAYLCIIGIGGYKVITGDLTIGYFSIINTYFGMIIHSISYFLGLAGTYQDSKVASERLNAILTGKEHTNGQMVVNTISKIDVKNLSVKYKDAEVLQNVNRSFVVGKIYGIQGKNGKGKSTLLNAILNIYAGEHSGEILYNDIPTDKLNMLVMRRKYISYLEQNPVQFNMSVKEYLTFGIDAHSEDTLQNLVHDFKVEYLMDGKMNDSGSILSGGEKQKLALIRVLSKKSNILLLDEPTSALDQESILVLIDFLNKIKKDMIIILVSHDRKILSECDNVIVLEDNAGDC